LKGLLAERVAVALMTLSLTVGAALGYATVRSYTSSGTPLVVGAHGQVEAAQSTPGDQASSSNGGATSGGSATSTGGSARASASQAASGVSKDAIKVGGFFDMTGPVDSSVERDTVKAYLSKVNDAGGVNGRRFQYVDCDSKYDVAAAHACATQLIQANVLAVVGWTAPQGEDGEVPDFNQAGIPIIGGLGTPKEFQYPLSYPVSASFVHYGDGLAAEAALLGIKRPSIVVITDIGWVAPVEKKLLDDLLAHGIQYADVEEAASTAPNYDQYMLGAAHGAGNNPKCGGCQPSKPCSVSEGSGCPDATIAALDPYSYLKLMQAMQRANFKPPKGLLAAGLDKGVFQDAYRNTGLLQGAHSLVPFMSPYVYGSNPTVADYMGTVQHYYPAQVKNLDIYTQIAWTAAMVFVEAVKRAGPDLTRATLLQALNSIQNFDTGWSRPLSYGPGVHDPNRCFRYMAYQDGWRNTSDWTCV
jgi:branched-chain amino acid transport system substrate-binding protein